MLLNKFRQQEKDALATQRELDALNAQKWNGAWISCEPFQYGWIRDWELRPDIAARDDANDFRIVLKHIGTNQWSKDRDFTWDHSRYCRSNKRLRKPMDLPQLKPITVRPVSQVCNEEEGWPIDVPERLKKRFYRHEINAPYCNCFGPHQYYRPAHYKFRTPWMFQLRVRPAFISKVPAVSGDLETKIARLKQHRDVNQYLNLLNRMRGCSNRDDRGGNRSRLALQIAEKELRQEQYEPTPDA